MQGLISAPTSSGLIYPLERVRLTGEPHTFQRMARGTAYVLDAHTDFAAEYDGPPPGGEMLIAKGLPHDFLDLRIEISRCTQPEVRYFNEPTFFSRYPSPGIPILQ